MPSWLPVLAIIWLALALFSSALILLDILACKRDMMGVMKWAWPITALYLGPLGLWAYGVMGRQGRERCAARPAFWQTVFKATTHCGAGCTLGDIIGEAVVFFLGVTIAGVSLWPEYIADFALAYLLGIAFQYFAIVPMRHLSPGQGMRAALKADTLSLTAFEVGLFGWMALMAVVFFHPTLHPDRAVYWFMMQIGMMVGFLTSYPMNWVLVRTGVKEAM